MAAAHIDPRQARPPLAKWLIALGIAAAAGCAHQLELERHPLVERIWDTRAGAFVSPEEVLRRAAAARGVVLGETHDNPEHHRLQLRVLEALAAGGPRRLAMEQFDTEYQPALDGARLHGADAEALADAGHFDREGWDWPRYRPLVEFALEHRWPLAAANLSRREARTIIADPSRSGLPAAPPGVKAALESDIIEGHCGSRPPEQRLAGMVEAQRARDARMAAVLGNERTVLIAGVGHARRDRGAPLYMDDAGLLSIAFMEVRADAGSPGQYFDGFASPRSFDYVWFTPRAVRDDPCRDFRAG